MSASDQPGVPDEDRPGVPAPSETASSSAVTIRRAPKFGVFIVGGALLGLVATVIVVASTMDLDQGAAATNDGRTTSADVGFWGLVGYFGLYGVTAGLVLGAVVAVVLDWRFGKRAARLTAERLDVATPQGPTDDGPDGSAGPDERDGRS